MNYDLGDRRRGGERREVKFVEMMSNVDLVMWSLLLSNRLIHFSTPRYIQALLSLLELLHYCTLISRELRYDKGVFIFIAFRWFFMALESLASATL